MAKHNWPIIKQFYVEGEQLENSYHFPTLQETAERFVVPHAMVEVRAGKEKWSEQRSIFQGKIEEKRQQSVAEQVGNEAADFDGECFKIAKTLVDFALQAIEQAAAVGRVLTFGEQRDIATIVDRAQRIGRLAAGDSTSNEKAVGAKAVFRIVNGAGDVRGSGSLMRELARSLSDDDLIALVGDEAQPYIDELRAANLN